MGSPLFQYFMPTGLTLTQEKASAFCPWQGKTMYCGLAPVQIHCTLDLHLPVDHIVLETDFMQRWSWWAGDGGAAWLLPSCWNALAAWQAGAMPTGTTIVTAFLFISAFRTKGGAGGDRGHSYSSAPGLGGLQTMFCLIPGNMEMRGRCCHQKWLWGIDALGR